MLRAAQPLLLLGAGKMGGAMLERWLELGLDPRRLAIVDPYVEPARWAALTRSGARLAKNPAELQGETFKVIIVAVKPQSMTEALASLRPLATPDAVIVSIAAGVRLEKLESAFRPGQPVVRVMPNTPAQVGMGMTVAIPNALVSDVQRAAVDALLSAVGVVAWIDDESQLDAVTAVSGSGPAYVFLLAECLAEAGRQAGLPADLADKLARQTVSGAGALLAASPLAPAELRENVTSPNGTTAAALSVLMAKEGLQPLLARAVSAAKQRSIELQ
jgi:pyrroline-5-carboxylate reductase